MLREWEKRFPGRLDSIFRAMANVVPTHLLDRMLHDFGAVRATGIPMPEGDRAIDGNDPPCGTAGADEGVPITLAR